MTYISSQSFTTPTRQSVLQIQAEMAKVQTEISTGRKADLGLSLGAETGTALSLQSQLDNLNSYTNSNSIASSRLSTTSNTLSTILSSAQSMAQSLTEATGVGGTAALQASAQSALQDLIGNLNTSSGNQFIFGGINTTQQPINAYTATSNAKTAADTAFQTYLAGLTPPQTAATISGSQMQTFLDGPFASLFSNSQWSANWSNASSQTIQTNVSSSQSLSTSVSANDSAFRPIAEAYQMITEFSSGLSADATTALVSTASQLVGTGISNLTNTASTVGAAQSTMDTVSTQISSQVQVLTNGVSDLESVDTAALSTQLTQLQTQLQASYEMTQQLSSLSLVNYFPTT